ncbi:hypothetical protein CQ14_07000 [Bradyrhizobium lablabi]|uniref:Uncharacterized protein n=1 Tax=Bradyrhizobium lablabi TaxID=722472 RepID=A0A0R3MP81_9BRAD|nr:hypothetical protein [Bradyrhizobium lablabi]KRR21390.1 hypothetical protein CQ14_07000 [Bradyrhizobium lablabi]
MIDRDAIITELSEIKAMIADDRLKDEDRFALFGAVQALSHVLDPDTWQPPSQTFYKLGDRPIPSPSAKQH